MAPRYKFAETPPPVVVQAKPKLCVRGSCRFSAGGVVINAKAGDVIPDDIDIKDLQDLIDLELVDG